MVNKVGSTFRRVFSAGGLGLILSACSPDATIEMKKGEGPKAEKTSNYSVTRVAIFEDELAYNNRRGIYEIVDLNTGKKYLGVSGIGICEIGSHSVGKSSVEDER